VPYEAPSPGVPPPPAIAFLSPDASQAVAQIAVTSDDGTTWSVVEDLLSSKSTDSCFVPEVESNGAAFLRFGDGTYGDAPDSGLSFSATYRVGNGSVGNVGRDALAHIILPPDRIASLDILSVRNPLAAAGGTDPEDMDHIRQWAPFAFQTQERCVTEDDYGQMAVQAGVISQAKGTLRWTGSWHTAFASVEPVGALSAQLIQQTLDRLSLLRMMGTDLAVEAAVIVGLKIQMQICVAPDHFAGDVYTALMQVFITGDQCNGQSGLLNAAHFSFGETVYASPLIAAAQGVDGVVAASLMTFTRMDNTSVDGVATGYLTMGRVELPRCDNDPNHLDHGIFELLMDGGK
jgi:predicted phage baseplate assembly protein